MLQPGRCLLVLLLIFGGFIALSMKREVAIVAAGSSIKIKQRNPVVNAGKQLRLIALDTNNSPVDGVNWRSGSEDIAQVDPNTGDVTGIKEGFATITATRGNDSVSVFIVVAKIKTGPGAKVPGDTKVDTSGKLYISNPNQNIILRADDALSAPIEIFAGKARTAGQRNGNRLDALFAGPTAISIDNGPQGGIYITDTLNHELRKINFNNQVETIIGNGNPGTDKFNQNTAAFAQLSLHSPRGIATDNGGNLYLADTENHAIYYLDLTKQQATLIAGEPGISGNDDGKGRIARFHRPSGIALNSDGRILAVADEDNNRVRLIEILRENNQLTGNVTTIGVASGNRTTLTNENIADEYIFNHPQSISFDGAGNIYVVVENGVQVITQPFSGHSEVISLAQADISFNQAASVVVKGTEVIVLDANAVDESEAIKVVTIGAPVIETITPDTFELQGGANVVIKGKNFAPESLVTFGDNIVDAQVLSATEIQFQVEPQLVPGVRTLSILTRGGLAQKELNVISKSASSIGIGEITTIAGGRVFNGDGGQAINASLAIPSRVVIDSMSNILIADTSGERVRFVDKDSGMITTIAGGGSSFMEEIPATIAQIRPFCLALDRSGDLYIGDGLTNSVRRVDQLTGKISTVAGGSGRPFGGDGGPAIAAGLGDAPTDILFDSNGNLFILANHRLRRVDRITGLITTVAGNGGTNYAGNNLPATETSFQQPRALTIDSQNNIYVGDTGSGLVRRIDAATGLIVTVAGSFKDSSMPIKDGEPATNITLVSLNGVAIDSADNLIIQDLFSFLRVDRSTGIINKLPLNIGSDPVNFVQPTGGMALDGNGNIFFTTFRAIERLNISNGQLSKIVGGNPINLRGDGALANRASIGIPDKALSDSKGNIYLLDRFNQTVRRIDAVTNIITTIFARELVIDNSNANDLTDPISIAISNSDDLYVGGNFRIYRFESGTGKPVIIAGNGKQKLKGDGKPALKAAIGSPFDITFDQNDNLYIASNGTVRRVDAKTSIITTVFAPPDKNPGVITINIVVDNDGNIYATEGGSMISRIDRNGVKKIIAGKGGLVVSGDGGPAISAGLGMVESLAINNRGELFVAAYTFDDNYQANIRKIDLKSGLISTLIGSKNDLYQGDGGSITAAGLVGIPQVSSDKNGNLLVLNKERSTIAALRFIKLAAD